MVISLTHSLRVICSQRNLVVRHLQKYIQNPSGPLRIPHIVRSMASTGDIEATPENISMEVAASIASPNKDGGVKRAASDEADIGGSKRLKEEAVNDKDDVPKESEAEKCAPSQSESEVQRPFRKKKVAIIMAYSGKGYFGMQRNPGMRTIEQDLMEALVKAGVVTQDHADAPGAKMHFQRAARTDKGVSAAGQMFIDVENPLEKINSALPEQIRVLGIKRVTKGFDSKNSCCGRTYLYMLPTYAFTPVEQMVKEDFRITVDLIRQVNIILASFVGTHNFYNYTSGKKPHDPSARRYIISFKMGQPFVMDGVEFAVISVKGQSFMLHQIRKMIGVTIAIMRGFASKSIILEAWGHERCDIPKAPGLGLMLDKVHYDRYNKNWGKSDVHEKLDVDEFKDAIDEFKKQQIFPTIVEGEREEKSMMKWLNHLHLHTFKNVEDETREALNMGSRSSSGANADDKASDHSEVAEEEVAEDQSSESLEKAAASEVKENDAQTSESPEKPEASQ